MSQVIPSPAGCDYSCPDVSSTAIPGPAGADGADGAAGSAGVSAFTFVANESPDPQPVMPAEGATETVNVTSSTAFVQANQFVFVAFWGTMKVFSVPNDSSLVLENAENTASGLYPGNAAPGTSLPAGSRITLVGEQGASGSTPANALISTNNLSDVADAATSRTNLGLGDAAQATLGVGNGEVAANDGVLTSGEFVQATANGIQTVDDATARTDMGLGTMATQNAGSVNISGGAVNATLGATTPSTIAATTIAASGAATLSGDVTHVAKTFTPSSAIQTLAAGNPVDPNASKVRVAGSGGAVTITATPSITNPAADGQRLLIVGTDDTNTVTLQDRSALGGSNLNLAGGANVTLGEGDVLDLCWDSARAVWDEVSRSNN